MDFKAILLYIWNLIGSALPLAVLCYILVFLFRGKKIKTNTLTSYIIISVIMFLILLRT